MARRSRLSTWLGFGAVAGTEEEAHRFLQQRIGLFLAFSFGIWAFAAVTQFATDLLVLHKTPAASLSVPDMFVPLAGAALLFAAWRVVKGPRRDVAVLHAADAGATALQAALLASLFFSPPTDTHPEFGLTMALSTVLVLRAAFVPSTAGRTLVVSGASWAVLLAAAVRLYADPPPLLATPPMPSTGPLMVGVWGAIVVANCTFITRLVHGLSQSAARALRLGQYELLAPLGAGGMGVVYRARHAMLRRPTAVKLLPPERAGASALSRFEREVQLTAALSHPHIVSIYDYGRTPQGVFYYAMELIDGLDLDALVRHDGPQPPARVAELLRQAAEALSEAHAAGLIHRDLKPGNLMVTPTRTGGECLKVLDFGLVQSRDEPPGAEGAAVLGTPLFIAPEAIADPASVDARSDLYSLGAVGYWLLTGRPVFEGDTTVAVCAQHLQSKVVPPSERVATPVPAELERLLLRCLEKQSQARWSSAQALADALTALTALPRDWSAATWWRERGPSLRRVVAPASPQPLTIALEARGPSS